MLLLYPEFTTGDVGRQALIATYIDIAARQINPTVWLDETNFITLTLAAHLIAFGTGRNNETSMGAAGAVTAKTTGENIASFSVQSKADGYDQYRTTSYGQIYLTFLFMLDVSPIVSA